MQATEPAVNERTLLQLPPVWGGILGSFFLLTLPLGWLLINRPPSEHPVTASIALLYFAVFGVSHFILTFFLYFQHENRRYFARDRWSTFTLYALPVIILLTMAALGAFKVAEAIPVVGVVTAYVLRIANYGHVGRQSFGVLQLFKGQARGQSPAWTKNWENGFFLVMAGLQVHTSFAGGTIALEQPLVKLVAAGLGVLFVVLLFAHVRAAQVSGLRAQRVVVAYFIIQALCSALAAAYTLLYAATLAVHYVEYHVIMQPRLFRLPLDTRFGLDRVMAFFRGRQLAFYLVLILLAFIATGWGRLTAAVFPTDPGAVTRLAIHAFDGLALFHFVTDGFLWKFRQPFVRQQLGPLYFAPWTRSVP
ncbi:MAG: hypothetical protein KC912_14085 [Proteobacteria bacterium]|nr:hypothetical protein [Pseudomonadota bacterium]